MVVRHASGFDSAEEARRALAEAKTILDQLCPDPARGQMFFSWWDWLHARFFVREAEGILANAKAVPAD